MMTPEGGLRAWLDAPAVQRASDILLAGILLVAGIVAIWDGRSASFFGQGGLNANFFPSVIGGLLFVTAIVLLARRAFFGPQAARWTLRELLTISAVWVALGFAEWKWAVWALRFGPPELAAYLVLHVTLVIALARRSRTRAVAMALVGLLLSSVGIDVATGRMRLTMGLDVLTAGFDPTICFLGIFIVADAALCLSSPSLFVATFARWIVGLPNREISGLAAWSMRFAAGLVFIAACLLAYRLEADLQNVILVLIFGAFGVVCKIFGWNRLVLYLALAWGNALEEKIRQSLLLSGNDPLVFFRSPVSALVMSLAVAVLMAGALLSVLRIRRAKTT